MAETPDKNKQPQMDLDDDDEIISLSDAELDTILGSAEITDAPIADIEVDLFAGGETEDTITRSEPDIPVSRDQPAARELPKDETQADAGGFFSVDEDESISLPEDELETILDTSIYADDEMESLLPETELVLVGDTDADADADADAEQSDLAVAEDDESPFIGGESSVVPDFSGPETPIKGDIGESFVIIDDQPLDGPAVGYETGSMIIEEEISPDTAMPELVFAKEQAGRNEPDPVVEVSGDSLDTLFDDEESLTEDDTQAETDAVLDDFEVEDGAAEIRLDDVDDAAGFDNLEDEQAPLEQQPQPPEFSLEEGAADYDPDGVDDLLIEEAPFFEQEVLQSDDTVQEIIDIEDEMIELEPVGRQEDLEESGRSEVVFEDEADNAENTADVSAESDDGFVQAPDFGEPVSDLAEDEIISLDLDDSVPLVDQIDLADDPAEFMDEEIVFSAHETIPAVPAISTPEEQAGVDEDSDIDEEIINPDLISEMKDEVFDEPELDSQPAAASEAEVRPQINELVEGMPERMRDDVRKVLGYLDNLFDELPEEKVKEFASSEYYDIYSRLFKELGI